MRDEFSSVMYVVRSMANDAFDQKLYPVSSIFFINRFSPLSDHGFIGNSDRKRFAP